MVSFVSFVANFNVARYCGFKEVYNHHFWCSAVWHEERRERTLLIIIKDDDNEKRKSEFPLAY